ncbi:YciE/YciF ferroxidase family protein [Flavobacterium sp.]|uniref:YciE/YciF ferroxidase family protein n=1 Tax=Flavobacterium sp. TaxID=239 RepID=UPI004033E203
MIGAVAKRHNEATELRGLFEKQLKQLYWAEGAMVNMLGGIIQNATSKDLVSLLERHRIVTNGHIGRIRDIFTAIGIDAEEQRYEAVQCLLKEAVEFIEATKPGVVRDAGLIGVLQKIKHYEIACYGTMRAYAIALREEDVVMLLEETLNEEKGADLLLTSIAESHINIEAADKEI